MHKLRPLSVICIIVLVVKLQGINFSVEGINGAASQAQRAEGGVAVYRVYFHQSTTFTNEQCFDAVFSRLDLEQ